MLKSNGKESKEDILSAKGKEELVPGYQGIAMISHGSEVTISIKTPLGRWYRIDTIFIGTNNRDEIFLELPTLSQSDLAQYFYAGFQLKVKAISEKGEGSIINFNTRISHIIQKPVRLLVLEMPFMVDLLQLRSEPRYDVKLQGTILLENRTLLVDFRDLSKCGCCFQHNITGLQFEEDTNLCILVEHPRTEQEFILTGLIKNTQRNGAMNRYGLQFDTLGAQQVIKLLPQLFFDGAKLSFK